MSHHTNRKTIRLGLEALERRDTPTATTGVVKDISPGPGSPGPNDLTAVGNLLFFDAYDPTNGRELWRSDGTEAGTFMLQDINPGTGGSNPEQLTAVGGLLYFVANDGSGEFKPWRSDGTAAGTYMLKDISMQEADFVSFGGGVYFTASDGTNGFELWRSNGTAAGTSMVKDIRPGPAGSTPEHMTVADGVLYFSAQGGSDTTLWRSDGTDAGTTPVPDLVSGDPYPVDVYPFTGSNRYAVLNGVLYFVDEGSDFQSGYELWRSDGTAAGTRMVEDIDPGADDSEIDYLTVAGPYLYFTANDGTHGQELWRTDGTNTVMVQDLAPGSDSSDPKYLTPFGDTLIFQASDGDNEDGLWATTGTGATFLAPVRSGQGTPNGSVSTAAVVGNTLYLEAVDADHGDELWQTDGTPDGTTPAADVNPGPSPNDSYPVDLTAVGDNLYFFADDGAHGTELMTLAAPADTTPPSAPTITAHPLNLTNQTDATFALTAADNLTPADQIVFQISQDSGAFSDPMPSPITLTGLTEGPHSVSIRAVDQAGNVGPEISFSWTVDLTPPSATIITSEPPALSNATGWAFTFSATDDVTPQNLIEFQARVDGSAPKFTFGSNPVAFGGLADGAHTASVQALDQAGNLGPENTYTWTVDATPPDTAIASGPAATTTDTAATFTFSGSDANGVRLFDYQLDGGDLRFTSTSTATFTDLSVGPHTLAVYAVDNAGNADATPATYSWQVVPVTSLTKLVTVPGANGGVGLFAQDDSGNLTPLGAVNPFPGYTGVVRTAVGDINGDNKLDVIVVTAAGGPLRVAVVSGTDNKTLLVQPFDPFGGGFTGGGFVSAGDLDGDGRAEFVVTPDAGGGPRVSIFSVAADGSVETHANFFGIDDPNFRGGATTAFGDVNGDGIPDLLVAAGAGGGPRVALFDGASLLTGPQKLTGDFFVLPDGVRTGVYLAIGDINGDGFGDIVVGAGPGGGPVVIALSGKLLLQDGIASAADSPLANFLVGNADTDRNGVHVATLDADGDALADLAVWTGTGVPSRVRVYPGKNITPSGEPTPFQDLDMDAAGVHVG